MPPPLAEVRVLETAPPGVTTSHSFEPVSFTLTRGGVATLIAAAVLLALAIFMAGFFTGATIMWSAFGPAAPLDTGVETTLKVGVRTPLPPQDAPVEALATVRPAAPPLWGAAGVSPPASIRQADEQFRIKTADVAPLPPIDPAKLGAVAPAAGPAPTAAAGDTAIVRPPPVARPRHVDVATASTPAWPPAMPADVAVESEPDIEPQATMPSAPVDPPPIQDDMALSRTEGPELKPQAASPMQAAIPAAPVSEPMAEPEVVIEQDPAPAQGDVDEIPPPDTVAEPAEPTLPEAAPADTPAGEDTAARTAALDSAARPAAADASDLSDADPIGFTLQLGVFRIIENAQELRQALTAGGYDSYLIETRDRKGQPLHRVRMGKFATERIAREAAAAFRQNAGRDVVVTRWRGQR